MKSKLALLVLGLMIGFYSASKAETVFVEGAQGGSYESSTIRQAQVGHEWGRYIVFDGTSVNYRYGLGGMPRQEYSFCSKGQCFSLPTPSYSMTLGLRAYKGMDANTYEIDCLYRTYARVPSVPGSNPYFFRFGTSVADDPIALAVADRYCPVIDTLERLDSGKSEPFNPEG